MQQTLSKKPISIRRAMKVVASDNYDKKNIFFYFLFVLVASIFSFLSEDKKHPNIIYSLLFICISFFSNAIYTVATSNAIHKRKGVFPAILKNFLLIFGTGVALSLGSVFWIIIMMIVTAVFVFLLISVNPVVAIIVSAIPLLILATFFVGACFNFIVSLSIKDWFDFKKALCFMKKAKNYFGSYLLRCILLPFLGGILFIPIGIIWGILGAFLKGEQHETALSGIILILASVIGTIISVYYLEITAQFVRATLREPKRIVKQKN